MASADAAPVVALDPSEQAIARRLMDELDRFNADATGIVDARELLLTELGEHGDLLGGLHGWSWGATCWIESLWVREDMRGSGLGGRLLDAVERLALDRGCLQLALETHSFQAPDFYRRHGFEVVGTLRDYPRGHDHLIMRKPLAEAARPARGSVDIQMHHGPRAGLRRLFELADDSPTELDRYLDAGRVLIAVDDGRIVGHLQLTEAAATLEVKNMAVLQSHERRGIGRALMRAAIDLARDEGHSALVVATASADIGNLRFYQRLGFRLRRIERDAFTEATGYEPQDVDGIPLRDRVWFDLDLRVTDDEITFRIARADEREVLEALQRRSSMHQPMYRAQLEAHPDAIELPTEQIDAGHVRVAEQDGAIVGFLVLLGCIHGGCELDGLFVDPDRMRGGIGRRLVEEARRMARTRGATRIDVVANPQATAFYEAVGFFTVSESQTRFGPAPRMSLLITP